MFNSINFKLLIFTIHLRDVSNDKIWIILYLQFVINCIEGNWIHILLYYLFLHADFIIKNCHIDREVVKKPLKGTIIYKCMNLLNWKKKPFNLPNSNACHAWLNMNCASKNCMVECIFLLGILSCFWIQFFFHLFIFYFNRLIITGWFHIFSK